MEKKLTTITLTVLSILLATTALASVFAYYPLTITVNPQAPGVIFQLGSNSNKPDLGGKTIAVTIGDNSTSASVTVNPTYQENYYKDVLRVYNGDSRAMNVYLVFTSVSNSLPQGSTIKLFFYDGATKVKELDITNPQLNQAISIGNMASGKTWQVDIYVHIPEGKSIEGASYTASAKLVYTPSSETPPLNPSGGR